MTADVEQLVKELKALPREKKLRLVERLEQDGFFDDNRSWKEIGGGACEDNQGRHSITPPGSDGRSLLHFAGTIDKNDLMIMQRTIDEGCEAVDQEGW